ncbi:GNAT family N-acetyltransferase [Gammaproteobacteria bacterium]|nr:GNAT family N-acetyltransferase [Gammaproteobacteria bacterium]
MQEFQIQTENLIISDFLDPDISDEYVSWLNNKDLMKYSEQRHKLHTIETSKKYLASFSSTPNYFLSIKTKKGEMIGTMTIYQDTYNKICDMGILIGSSSSRGKGYGFEAWIAAIKWVELNLKPRKITAGAVSANKSMLRLMEKSNMHDDGQRKEHYLIDGKSMDIIFMAIHFHLGKRK